MIFEPGYYYYVLTADEYGTLAEAMEICLRIPKLKASLAILDSQVTVITSPVPVTSVRKRLVFLLTLALASTWITSSPRSLPISSDLLHGFRKKGIENFSIPFFSVLSMICL